MTNCEGHDHEQVKILPDWNKVLVSREEFLKALGFCLSGIIGVMATVPGVAFILNYLFVPKEPKWVNLGKMTNFNEGETVLVGFQDPYILPWDGVSAHRSAWLRRLTGDDFTAFATSCTHLGCPVRWKNEAQLFMCPCHGGVYYKDGEVAGGPPPHPLHRYPVRLTDGGVQIQVGVVLTETVNES